MIKRFFPVLFLFAIIIGSCYYDKEEYLYPVISNTCDTSNVTFSGSIIPLLQNNCLSCHSNNYAASQGGNVRLQDYTDVTANKAKVWTSINRVPGVTPMPKGGAKLKECFIHQVELWINQGAPYN